MKRRVVPPLRSLRTKLVLSYLAVTLGAILTLSIVVALAVPYYFAYQLQNQFVGQAQAEAQQAGQEYYSAKEGWDYVHQLGWIDQDTVEMVVDTNLNLESHLPDHSRMVAVMENNVPAINRCLQQALQGQDGTISHIQGASSGDDGPPLLPSMYVCEAVHDNGQQNGQIVGALLLIKSEQYGRGSPPYSFIFNVSLAILFASGAIALVVAFFSFILARGLTNPLRSLTRAAEKMQGGDYAQRVVPPASQDEIEHLSLAFNAMADTIEADVNELRRQEQLRRDLIANTAHDMLTPLTAVQGFSEALADEVITDARARQETAQLIGREVQRLRRLVSDMQHMTSLEAGRLHFDFAPLNLYELVNETLAVIEFECNQQGITLRNEMPPWLPLVQADGDRITQVLLNLLDNARRHTPTGGTVTLGAESGERDLKVWVNDTGTGIATADLPYIFERFYRADRSRTGTTGGSGLGLSIVKAIITAHGGTIHAESQPGVGTRILFTLPLAREELPSIVDLDNPYA
ncbi:MAG TPA: HAMP domain-containing sensor histidine kinase [Ktedonobacteraceae bacterium]|nr:HAMP domain-containing sensor histidine kinase [Ktedonobacteraceae bacterium]